MCKMSSMYYKATPPTLHPKPVVRYGYKKVSSAQLHQITERLVKTTYNRHVASSHNQKLVHNYEHLHDVALWRRTPTACYRRTSSSSIQGPSANRLSDRDMQKLIRRLAKPTESFTNSQIKLEKDPEEKFGRIVRTTDIDDSTLKCLINLSRPTTASRAKTVNECHLCHDHRTKSRNDPPDAFDYEYMDDRIIPEAEMEYIVCRMTTPTCSSAGSKRKCSKTPVYIDEVKIRQHVPLVSGLQRSKNVFEVVDRLHPKSRFKLTPMATPVTVY